MWENTQNVICLSSPWRIRIYYPEWVLKMTSASPLGPGACVLRWSDGIGVFWGQVFLRPCANNFCSLSPPFPISKMAVIVCASDTVWRDEASFTRRVVFPASGFILLTPSARRAHPSLSAGCPQCWYLHCRVSLPVPGSKRGFGCCGGTGERPRPHSAG